MKKIKYSHNFYDLIKGINYKISHHGVYLDKLLSGIDSESFSNKKLNNFKNYALITK